MSINVDVTSKQVTCPLPPATKSGQGHISTGVRDSLHRGGAWSRGVHGPGGVAGGEPPSPKTATAGAGTHPTGMHSCLN